MPTKIEKVTLSEIAKSAKIDAKTARRRMRASGYRKPSGGWAFRSTEVTEVRKIIKGETSAKKPK